MIVFSDYSRAEDKLKTHSKGTDKEKLCNGKEEIIMFDIGLEMPTSN